MDTRSAWDNYLVLDYRRTLKRFSKLHQRYLKRRQSNSFEELSRRKQYYLVRKLRKLKTRLDQLLMRLKMGVAAGTIAASVMLSLDAGAQTLTEGNDVTISTSSGTKQMVASDIGPEGDMVVVWRDASSGDIQGQLFNSNLEPEGGELTLVDASVIASQSLAYPDVALDENGEFVVVIDRYISGDPSPNSVWIQRFDGGESVLESLSIYSDFTSSDRASFPQIAMNDDGDFVVAWQDYDSGDYSILSRSNIDGTWGDAVTLNENTTGSARQPDVAITNDGDFVVAWSEYVGRYSTTDYFALKYKRNVNNSFGSTITAVDDFVLTGSPGTTINVELPSINLDENDNLLLGFIDNDQNRVRTVTMDSNDNQIRTTSYNTGTFVDDLDIAVDPSGNINIAYTDGSNFDFIRLNEFGSYIQGYNAISIDGINSVQVELAGDDVITVFTGPEFSNDAVYKKFSAPNVNSIGTGEFVKINDESNYSAQELHLSEADDNGDFIAVWKGTESSSSEIFAQRFNQNGEKVGSNITVTRPDNGIFEDSPKVALDDDGNFIVAWLQGQDLVFKQFDANGDSTSLTVAIAAAGSDINSNRFDIAIQDDEAVIVYRSTEFSNEGLKANRISGSTVSSLINISGTYFDTNPAVAIDESGDAIIVWEDYTGGDYTYLTAVTMAGGSTTLSSEFNLSFDVDGRAQGNEATAIGDNEFVVAWHGDRKLQLAKVIDGEVQPATAISYSESNTDVNSISYSEEDILIGSGYTILSVDSEEKLRVQFTDEDYSSGNGVFAVRTGNRRFFAGIVFGEPRLTEIFYSPPTDPFPQFVNTTPDYLQINPDISRDEDGDYVVVWESFYSGELGVYFSGIYAQAFNDDKDKIGPEIEVAKGFGGDQIHSNPSVVMDDDGSFIIVWDKLTRFNEELVFFEQEIVFQRYDSQGSPVGDEVTVFEINSGEVIDDNNRINTDVTSDGQGNFLIAWSERTYGGSSGYFNHTVRYQRYDSDGNTVGDLQTPFTTNYQGRYFDNEAIVVDMNEDGDFVVLHQVFVESEGVYGYLNIAKYNSEGSQLWTDGFGVDYIDNMRNDVVLMDNGFVAATFLEQPDGTEIKGVVFDELGDLVIEPFRIVYGPSRMSMDKNVGGFAVTFPDNNGIELKRYDYEGKEVGKSSIVDGTTSVTGTPSIGIDESGDAIVVWSQYGDGSYQAILSKEVFTPYPKVNISPINVVEGETVDMTNSVIIGDNFGSRDWAFQVLEPTTHGTSFIGSQALNEGSTFLGSEVEGQGTTYEHDGTETAIDRFVYEVKNFFGYSRTIKGPIFITNTNDLPVLESATADQTTDEDVVFELNVGEAAFSDEESETLTFSATQEGGAELPSWIGFNSSTVSFSGTPANGDVGVLSVELSASDGENEISDIFTITVQNVNDAPTGSEIPVQEATEDVAFAFNVSSSFSDPDVGDALTFSAVEKEGTELPSWLSLNTSTGEFTGTPGNAEVGTVEITVTATDNSSVAVSGTLTINVGNTNDAPVVQTIADQNATEDSPFTFDVSALFSDEDAGEALTYSAKQEDGSDLPTWLSLDPATGQFAGTPTNENVGTIFVEVTGTDGSGASASDVFAIEVANVNDAPDIIGSIEAQTAIEGEDFSFEIKKDELFSDVDSPGISIELKRSDFSDLPNWLSFDSETGILSGTPSEGDIGELEIRVIASDGETVTSISFLLTVEAGEKLGLSQESIVVYPNPTDSYVQFDWVDQSEKLIRIYDYQGKLSKELWVTNEQRIDVSTLPNGNYVLSIERNQVQISSFKLVIKHNN